MFYPTREVRFALNREADDQLPGAGPQLAATRR